MRATYTLPASLSPSLLLLMPLLLLLSMVTHLNEAAAVVGVTAADKEVAPVGVVKTDLLSLEQEIVGNPVSQQGVRHARSFLFGAGPPIYGGGYGWGYPNYGFSTPYYGYGGYGGYGGFGGYAGYGGYGGYYPSPFGFKKIIFG